MRAANPPTTARAATAPIGRPVRSRSAFRAAEFGETAFQDMIKGRVTFQNEELDDLIIARSDGSPTYNFCVVVDDHEMAITHVIRGEDHVTNTPKQIQLYEAMDYPVPAFAHVPLILGLDRTRLSKRHGATSVTAYRDQGFFPEAMINYLARLGWSYGDQEIFSITELLEKFAIEDVGKSAGVFDLEKLSWVNSHYMKTLAPRATGGRREAIPRGARAPWPVRGVDRQDGGDVARACANARRARRSGFLLSRRRRSRSTRKRAASS